MTNSSAFNGLQAHPRVEEEKEEFQERLSHPFGAGEKVILKATGVEYKVAYVAYLGDPGHCEVRYYLDGEGDGWFHYADDLRKSRRKGWGRNSRKGFGENG